MSATEERIVRMKFDNAQFKKAAGETQTSLSNIDKAVSSAGKGRGLLDMAGHMETVRVKAGAMQIAAVTAIANIANRAVNAGIAMAKSFSLDPIKAGFDEYELKMKSIQTILANTKGENLKSVTLALNELNKYSDKTIYNFANMTENIGKLTTAGISLKDSTAVVKGFHNMVALAGGDATAAAGAMEQFGQGLQAGTIKAIDWMSISNRGLGSQNLQKAFYETAKAMGTISDVPVDQTFEEWTTSVGGFKGSLEDGWLTADVATKALSYMTGDVKDVSELMKQGFSRKAAEDLLRIADNAVESATKVRTFSAFMDTTKEALGSGWGQVMEVIFGDFNESTRLFTKLSTAVGNVINKFFGYIMRLIEGFDKLGGRIAVMETIKNVLSPIVAIVGLIAKGWKAVFGGGDTGRGLATFAKALQHITRPLRIFAKLISGQISPLEALKRLFQVTQNAGRNFAQWIGGLLSPLTKFVSLKVPGGSGIIQFIKDLIEWSNRASDKLRDLVKNAKGFGDFFSNISFSMPDMPSLPSMPSMGSIFGGDDTKAPIVGLASGLDAITNKVSVLKSETSGGLFNPDAKLDTSRISDTGAAVDTLHDKLGMTKDEAVSVGDWIRKVMSGVGDWIKEGLKGFSMDDLMASFNLAVLSTFMISISRFFNTLTNSFKGFVGTGEAVNGILENAGNALKSFQTQARAKLILNIAIAVGILAAALWLLSKIPLDKMATGLTGMAGIMFIMKTGVDAITKAAERMEGKGTALKLTGLSIALLALGFAVLTLSAAFLILNKVDWSSMLKGLLTIVVVMKTMEMMGKVGEHGAKNLLGTAVALGALAVSFVVLAGALLLFQLVKWESMAKAGLVLAALTAAIGLLALIPYEGIAKVGLAMLSTSVGMLAIANALILFSLVKWESIGKASVILTVLTVALAALMYVGGGPVGAATILAMGAALMMLAGAGMMLNLVDWSSIGKIALIMTILVVAFTALLAVITVFAPALIILSLFAGQLALLALAITGLTLAFAAIFPLLAMGAGAFAAFATGAAIAFAVFVQTLALQAPIIKNSFLKILQTLIDGIVEAVPMIIDGVKRLWKAITDEFTGGGGAKKQALMGDTGKSWVDKLGDGIKKMVPKIVDKAIEIGKKFLDGLIRNAGALAAKGAEFVVGIINGIASKAGDIVAAAVNLVVKFAEGLGQNLQRIVDAGIKLIADFLHALANGIRNGAAAIGGGITDVLDAMKDVGVDMVKGLIGGIGDMFGEAMSAIGDLASGMVNKAKGILKIFSPSRVFRDIGKFLVGGLTKGIQDNATSAITATASMVTGSIAIATQYVSKFVQDLDQQALAAQARAEGLQAAAERAAKAAEKTKKNKKDDRSARRLQDKADKATRRADRQQARVDEAKAAQDRADEFDKADLITRAEMRSEDAQIQIDEAKDAERSAASKLAEANALRQQAKAKGVNKKDAKAMRAAADKLEKEAAAEAQRSNALIAAARVSAADAMEYQRQAGAAAAAAFQERYNNAAKEDADAAAYEKLTDEEKAAERRRQATILQQQADADLQRAKELAYSDLEAANELADEALAKADQARQYLDDAAQLDLSAIQATDSQSIDTGGTIVNLDPTETASIAFNEYAQRYNAALAATAADTKVEFNQYNTSPEYLSEADIYRRTHNQLDFAGQRLGSAA